MAYNNVVISVNVHKVRHFILAMFSRQPLHLLPCCDRHYASDLDSACLWRCNTLPHSFQPSSHKAAFPSVIL